MRWWWLSRVEGVVRSCDTHFSPGDGNIIEHYVYRFVTVGRACLVSNTAIIPLSFPSSIYIHFLLLFLYTCKENHYSDFPSSVYYAIKGGKLLEICRRSFRFELPRAIAAAVFRRTKRCIPTKATVTRRTSATCVINDRSLCTFNYRLLRSKC